MFGSFWWVYAYFIVPCIQRYRVNPACYNWKNKMGIVGVGKKHIKNCTIVKIFNR